MVWDKLSKLWAIPLLQKSTSNPQSYPQVEHCQLDTVRSSESKNNRQTLLRK